MKPLIFRLAVAYLMTRLLTPANASQLEAPIDPQWTVPLAPFRIANGLYYVGSQDLASYLIVTSAGNILINAGLESSVPLIKSSVELLGFNFTDTKILLISHGHYDHDAGANEVKHLTGAKYWVMDDDVSVVETGGAQDFAYAARQYPPATVDRVLHDGDEVRLGHTILIAHKTGGHTRGCTTWTMRTRDRGRLLDVVIVGSAYVNPGYQLLDIAARHASYPGIADDYRRTFKILKRLPCDVFLSAHGSDFDMLEKLSRATAQSRENVWIDPHGYRDAIGVREREFRMELKRELAMQ